ncbi:MAG: NAD(P)-dependent oxidoreductase [Candidatus Euphemobacter frigidus]|nr:NAD(P)-dependent oxidoreductase [Candidatus Euphemobacter frigidus]
MKIIITGAGGFVGKNLLLNLPPRYRILALDREESLSRFIDERGLENVECAAVDLNDGASLDRLSKTAGEEWDAVIYLAGNGDPAYSVGHPREDLRDSAGGLISFFSRFRARQVVYFSSGAVYDGISGQVSPDSFLDPLLPYAIGKLACEQYVKFFRKIGRIGNYIILRFFGAYGPYEPPRKIYTRLVRNFAIEKKDEFTIRGDGKNLIDAMFIDDTVRGVEAMLKSGVKDRVVDFCVGKPYTIKKLVEEAARVFNVKVRVRMEGEVPEYINFLPSPRPMEDLFGFIPTIPLSKGLLSLARHLKNEEKSI